LDFSTIFPQSNITSAITVDGQGHLMLEGKRQRFFCAAMMFTPVQGYFPSHDKSDELARALRLQGYNLVRLLNIERSLITGKAQDFSYDDQQMDRWLYFLAALKREGVYWMLDLATSHNGSYGDVGTKRRLKGKHQLKLAVHYSDKAQYHWKQQLGKIFDRINPYTKQKILTDPALLAVTLFNEGGLNFNTRKTIPDGLKQTFYAWLAEFHAQVKKRFPSKQERSA